VSERHRICAKCVHGVIHGVIDTDGDYPCPDCRRRDEWCKRNFADQADRRLSERAFYADARIFDIDRCEARASNLLGA
jgi:hypothetical protein